MPQFCNPEQALDPQAWLALPEDVRIAQAQVFHPQKRLRTPGPRAQDGLSQAMDES